jgi:hypothetical protein
MLSPHWLAPLLVIEAVNNIANNPNVGFGILDAMKNVSKDI